jgi:hypothetical protein
MFPARRPGAVERERSMTGCFLIVPDDRAAFLADLEEETGTLMFRVAQRLACAVRGSGIRRQGVNLLLADGQAAMQAVFHQSSTRQRNKSARLCDCFVKARMETLPANRRA